LLHLFGEANYNPADVTIMAQPVWLNPKKLATKKRELIK